MFSLFRNLKKAIGFSVLTALFTLVVYKFSEDIQKAKATKQWPTTQGVMTKSNVTSKTERNSDGDMVTMYTTSLSYDYTVDGTQYTSDNYMLSKYSSSSRQEFDDIAKQFAVNKTVTVYYNPKDFAEGILKTGSPTFMLVMFYVFALIVVILWLVVINTILKVLLGTSLLGFMLAKKGAKNIGINTQQAKRTNTKPVEHNDDAFDIK